MLAGVGGGGLVVREPSGGGGGSWGIVCCLEGLSTHEDDKYSEKRDSLNTYKKILQHFDMSFTRKTDQILEEQFVK